MTERFIYTIEMLGLLALGLFLFLLPAIAAQLYVFWARQGRMVFSPGEYDRIDRRACWILCGGYLALISAFFFVTAPVHAAPVVNAASIVRAKCLRTPPELRSPKCVRLVGR